MTRKDRQRFSREFKLEAVRLANESGKLATDVARDLGISVQALYKWQDEVAKQGNAVFPGHGRGKKLQDDELSRLKRENSQLREERDILKKAVTFFAREK